MRLFREINRRLHILEGKVQYSYVTDFNNGYALAIQKIHFDGCGKLVIINDEYEKVIDTQYFYLYPVETERLNWLNGYTILHDSNSIYIFDTNLKLKRKITDITDVINIKFKKKDGNEWIELTVSNEKDYKERRTLILDNSFEIIFGLEFDTVKYIGYNEFVGIMNNSTIVYNLQNHIKNKVNGQIMDVVIYNNKKYYKFKENGKYGYYNEKFEIVIVADNDTLSGINKDDNIAFMENGRSGIINIETKKKKFW